MKGSEPTEACFSSHKIHVPVQRRQARETSGHLVVSSDYYLTCPLLQGRNLKSALFTNSHRTPGAIPAVVGALWLDAAALGALVDDLSWLQLQAFHVLLCGIAFGDSPLCTQIEFRLGEREAEQ